jgi:hypothetical protein
MLSNDTATLSNFQDGTAILVVNGRPVIQLGYQEAAHFLGMSLQALRDRVHKGLGPRPTTIGRRVFFSISELVAYSRRNQEAAFIALPAVKRGRGRPRKYE